MKVSLLINKFQRHLEQWRKKVRRGLKLGLKDVMVHRSVSDSSHYLLSGWALIPLIISAEETPGHSFSLLKDRHLPPSPPNPRHLLLSTPENRCKDRGLIETSIDLGSTCYRWDWLWFMTSGQTQSSCLWTAHVPLTNKISGTWMKVWAAQLSQWYLISQRKQQKT